MYYTIESIRSLCQSLHTEGRKLVLATGFFDLLHQEHLNFLSKAKALGDILIVAVESDERARALKGEGRPIEPQKLRLAHLTSYADYLVALDPSFNNPLAFENLISNIRPHFLAVSSHTAHQDKKRALVEKYGGKLVIVHEFNPAISTSQIIQNTKI